MICFYHSVEDNPNLDGACASESCAEEKKKSFVVPVVASVGGLLVILTVAAVIFWIMKLRNKPQDQSTVPAPRVKDISSNDSLEVRRRQFTYSEVVRMTDNFAMPLGEGGSGKVFLGYVDNVQVAVKMLFPLLAHSYQQFQTEASNLNIKIPIPVRLIDLNVPVYHTKSICAGETSHESVPWKLDKPCRIFE